MQDQNIGESCMLQETDEQGTLEPGREKNPFLLQGPTHPSNWQGLILCQPTKEKYLQRLPPWSQSRQRIIDVGLRDSKFETWHICFHNLIRCFPYMLQYSNQELFHYMYNEIYNKWYILFSSRDFLIPSWLVSVLTEDQDTWCAFQGATECNQFPKNRTHDGVQPPYLHGELWMASNIHLRCICPPSCRFYK